MDFFSSPIRISLLKVAFLSFILGGLFTPFAGFSWAAGPSKVPDNAEDAKPLEVGDKIPPLQLTNADGLSIDLRKLVKQQPTVLIFYRGGWCIYCNRHFGQLKTIETPLQKLGYQIIAISPDRVEKLRESLKKHKMKYMLVSDSDAKAMKAFGVAFRVDDKTFNLYKSRYNIDLEADSGQTHHILPVPTAYVVDQEGIIRYRYTNPNYKIRVDPQELYKNAQLVLKK